MTIAEVVKQKTEALDPDEQQRVLHFVESLGELKQASGQRPKSTLDAVNKALAAAAGIWKDRTDLPEDSVEASQLLRQRIMQRGSH